MKFYLGHEDDVLPELNMSETGFEQTDVQKRLMENGKNELVKTKKF